MNVKRRDLVALWLVLFAAACAGSGSELDGLEPLSQDELTIVVNNQNFYDATIYATVAAAPRWRVGSVPGNTSRTLAFRWTWIEVQFEIRLMGAGTIRTGAISVQPGDVLELTIPPDADRGVIRRRP